MAQRTVGIVLFDGFELLDVVGPMELLSRRPDEFEILLLGPEAGPVSSGQGSQMVAGHGYEHTPTPSIVLVPGGPGTRILVEDQHFLRWLRTWSAGADLVTSVCTGSALLAAAGLLDGYRATSNKRAFAWVSSLRGEVEWMPRARWVQDGTRWTSSGVAAGMDMTAALIGELLGPAEAERVAWEIELEVRQDPTWDPFAVTDDRG